MRHRAASLLPAMAMLLAGCVSSVPYERPALPVPTAWQQPVASADDINVSAWWQAFADPELLRLQALARDANPDLQIALRHMLAARDGVDLARAQQALQLSLGAAPVDAAAVSAANRKTGLYAIGFSARYELDFWGRLARGVDAAQAVHEASRFDAGTIQISLEAQLARSYFRLRELDERLALQADRLSLLREAQSLAQARLRAGRTSSEPVESALGAVATAESERDQLLLDRRQTELQLSQLLGQAPEALAIPSASLRSIQLPFLPALLPATVVERRPDLRAAEQRLREAHADVAVARAEWLPKISLDAELGLVTGPLRAPLRGSRGLVGIGPELDWTLLDGGRRKAEIDARGQAREIAVLDYRKAVLAALVDVETSLLLRDASGAQHERLIAQVERDRQSGLRMQHRLDAGRGSRQSVIEAQAALLASEQAEITAYRERLDSAVALYSALGGGWTRESLPSLLQAPQ